MTRGFTTLRAGLKVLPSRAAVRPIRPFLYPMASIQTTSSSTHLDIAREIQLDHDNVRDLFERFKNARVEEKGPIANTLIREMAIHSDAEEISLYNELDKYGFGDMAAHNREEHAEVKQLVYQAYDASASEPDYDRIVGKAVTQFIAHATEEEQDEFPKLKERLTVEESDRLAREFLSAREKVPTRPHPSAPVSGGIAQKAAGMGARLHDRIWENISARKFVPVKYQHPTTSYESQQVPSSQNAYKGQNVYS